MIILLIPGQKPSEQFVYFSYLRWFTNWVVKKPENLLKLWIIMRYVVFTISGYIIDQPFWFKPNKIAINGTLFTSSNFYATPIWLIFVLFYGMNVWMKRLCKNILGKMPGPLEMIGLWIIFARSAIRASSEWILRAFQQSYLLFFSFY